MEPRRCIVCGEPLFAEKGRRRVRKFTCGAPHCRSVLDLNPQLKTPELRAAICRTRNRPDPSGPLSRRYEVDRYLGEVPLMDQEMAGDRAEHYKIDSSDWCFGDEHLSADLRALHVEGTDDVWHYLQRVPVLYRVREQPGAVTFDILRKRGESTVGAFRRVYSGGVVNRFLDCQIFLAWRCRCSLQTRYDLARIDDLPEEPGPHGSCPACGATPVLVEVEDDL